MEKFNRLIIDARPLTEIKAGVARYIENIARYWSNSEYEIILISNKEIISSLPFKKKVFKFFRLIPGSIFVSFILPLFLKKGDIFWGTCHVIPLYRTKSILTIHDLVSLKYPQYLNWTNRIMNRLLLKTSIKKCLYLTSVSKFTKLELRNITNKEIITIRNSVDMEFFTKGDNKINDKYILSLSTLEPRKNLDILVQSFLELQKKELYNGNLILIGAKGWLSEEKFKKIQNSKGVYFTGYLSDYEIRKYYSNCDLFVYPSEYEGFGIPPLEAHVTGAKVVSTTKSEIPYLNLNNTFLYDPEVDNLTTIILHALNEPIINKPNYNGSWENESMKLNKLVHECFN